MLAVYTTCLSFLPWFIQQTWSSYFSDRPRIYILFHLFANFSNQSFTVVRVTASLLRSPGLFTVIKSILTEFWFLIPTVFFPNLWGPFQAHERPLVSPSSPYSTVFLLWQGPSIRLSFHVPLFSTRALPERQNPQDDKLFFLVNYH